MPDTASITLEVAPSDKLQQLVDQITAMTGGGDEGGGGGGRQNMAGRIGKMGKAGTKMVQTGLKKAGVSFSMSAMLKQSQIFTGFLGSLFQILGGFLDVLLAPLIPILMPLLVFLGRMIPVVGKLAQILLGPFVFIIELVMKLVYWILGFYINLFESFLDNVKEKFEGILEKFKTAWDYLKNGEIWEAAKLVAHALWDLVTILPQAQLKTVVDTMKSVWDWLIDFKLVQDLRDWWNALFAESIKPWIASIWNPIVDGMQFIMDKLVEGINAISPFKDIGKVDLASLKMIIPEVTEPLPKLPPGATDVPLPPGYNMNTQGPQVNVEFFMYGVEPQEKVEMEVDSKHVAVTTLGMQLSNIRP